MSLSSYRRAVELARADESFEALIMAALMRADSFNFARLTATFPDLADETNARYHAASGLLPSEPGYAEIQRARAELGMPPT